MFVVFPAQGKREKGEEPRSMNLNVAEYVTTERIACKTAFDEQRFPAVKWNSFYKRKGTYQFGVPGSSPEKAYLRGRIGMPRKKIRNVAYILLMIWQAKECTHWYNTKEFSRSSKKKAQNDFDKT